MEELIEALSPEFWAWVHLHMKDAMTTLAADARKVMTPKGAELALIQIEARRKTGHKLRNLLSLQPNFLFPSTLLAEQRTAPAVADFNASILGDMRNRRVADLTFGLGFDAFAFASDGAIVSGVDRNIDAVAAGNYNASLLGLDVEVECADSIEWMKQSIASGQHFDLLFVDPARRNKNGGRTYGFDDSEPDLHQVSALADQLADGLLAKGSPMLDPDDIMMRWPTVRHIWCVGLKGECKELLLHFDYSSEPHSRTISSVEINEHGDYVILDDTWPRNRRPWTGECPTPHSGMWICLPSAAVIKGRPRQAIMERWPEMTCASASGLFYLSDTRPVDFPGRSLYIEDVYDGLRKAMRALKGENTNVAVVGYPATADALRTKLKLHPIADNSRFLIGCSIGSKRYLLWCKTV